MLCPQQGGNAMWVWIFLEDVSILSSNTTWLAQLLRRFECFLSSRLSLLNLLSNFRPLTSQNSTSPRQSHRRQIRTISLLTRSIRNRLGNLTLRFVWRISSRRDALCGSMTSACTGVFGADSYTLSWSCRLYSNCLLYELENFQGRNTVAVKPEYL